MRSHLQVEFLPFIQLCCIRINERSYIPAIFFVFLYQQERNFYSTTMNHPGYFQTLFSSIEIKNNGL